MNTTPTSKSVLSPQRSPSPANKELTPYCEGIAFLKCPNCKKCIPLTADETLDSSGSLPDLSFHIRRLKGDDGPNNLPPSNTPLLAPEAVNGTATGPSAYYSREISNGSQDNRFAGQNPMQTTQELPSSQFLEVPAQNPRESTPVPNAQQGANIPTPDPNIGTTISATTDTSSNDPFLRGRIHNSPVIELRQNPIADLPCATSGSLPRSPTVVRSMGFEIGDHNGLDRPNVGSTVSSNTNGMFDQRRRDCDEAFENDMRHLGRRLQDLVLSMQPDQLRLQ